MVDSLEFSTLNDIIEFLTENLPESEGIQISSPNWDGYVSSYPGIYDEHGNHIPTNKTLAAKYFNVIPQDAMEIINKIDQAKMKF
jgi:hypothetical protein